MNDFYFPEYSSLVHQDIPYNHHKNLIGSFEENKINLSNQIRNNDLYIQNNWTICCGFLLIIIIIEIGLHFYR